MNTEQLHDALLVRVRELEEIKRGLITELIEVKTERNRLMDENEVLREQVARFENYRRRNEH